MTDAELPIKIGFIINPISGMGGSVGLKGTDGRDVLERAIKLGAEPTSDNRAREFLQVLKSLRTKILIITAPGIMGETLCKKMGFKVKTVNESIFTHPIKLYKTTGEDTRRVAEQLKKEGVSIIIFLGGDGTAKDILNAIKQDIPCLGVPAGVKIHSSVFSINPQKAAQLTMEFLWGEAPLREAEVLDIDEDEFRNNRVVSKLFGFLLTPYSPIYSQPSKMASPSTEDEHDNQEAIARWVIEEMENDIFYVIGPGTTTKAITDLLNLKKTLLGIDLMRNKKVIASDLNEQQILKEISNDPAKLIITPIGRQGFIFGRGNLQLSAKVLNRIGIENLIIICSKYKFSTLPNRKLRIDTRDPELDKRMGGMYKILVDYGEFRIATLE
ncbi:MAG: ATP-NAD kinase family protein [Promethearchaeota archaeon]